VQAHLARGTDVHRGALADGLKPGEDFDGSGVVLVPSTLCGRILFVTHESCVSSVRCSVLRRWLANVLTNLNLANQFLQSAFTISFREGCRADVLEPALPIGPVSLMFELGLEGCFPLHPAPFRNFGGARRSVFLSDLRRVFLFRSPIL
jgi:hypothetical protein